MSELLNVQINGEWKKFPKGTRLIDACAIEGQDIPHFCYHEKLSIAGNCRMCMVELGMPKMTPDRKPVLGVDGFPEIAWSPKPAIACATDISEGMGVRTDSPVVVEARQATLEFLLLNHPLDCPICDQAGECTLQEYAIQYGKTSSRIGDDKKIKKPKRIEIGPRIMYDGERCVLCGRCVRFMREVAKDDALGFAQRGTHSFIAAAPCKPLDSNYSLNTVDLCPVGALTAKDFRFQMRTWFLKETKTIDVHCGLGSNITVSSRENTIYRVTPRENPDVNNCWLPDSHRLAFHDDVHASDRLVEPFVPALSDDKKNNWIRAIEAAAKQMQAANGRLALIASASLTCEELYMVKRIADAFKIEDFDVLPRPQQGDGLLVSNDGNANTRGAQVLALTTEKLPQIASRIASGDIKTLVVIGEDATKCGIATEQLDALESLIVIATRANETTRRASVLLPMTSWAEKCGTLVNINGRIQRLNAILDPLGDSRRLWRILRDLLHEIFVHAKYEDFSHVFAEMVATVPSFEGLTLEKIGDLGIEIECK